MVEIDRQVNINSPVVITSLSEWEAIFGSPTAPVLVLMNNDIYNK